MDDKKTFLLKSFLKIKTKKDEEEGEKKYFASPAYLNSPDASEVPLPNFDEDDFFKKDCQ